MAVQFREAIHMPMVLLLGVVTFVTATIALLVGGLLFADLAAKLSALQQALLIATLWSCLLAAYWFTNRIQVEIKDLLQGNGNDAPTLIVRGNKSGTYCRIPIDQVTTVREVTFAGPPWRTTVTGGTAESANDTAPDWGEYLSEPKVRTPAVTTTISLPGYQGPGLLIIHRSRSVTNPAEERWFRKQFPTTRPGEIRALIESLRPELKQASS